MTAIERLEKRLNEMGGKFLGITVSEKAPNAEAVAEQLLKSLDEMEAGELEAVEYDHW